MNPVNLFPSSPQCTSDVKPAYLVDEKQEEYDNSDSYIYIYYISDIHLEVKLSPEAFLDEHVLHNELCQKISSLFTKKFIQSISHRQKNNIVLFLGDIADTIHVSQLFYSMFIKKMKKYTSDTSLPIYAVLGNHEYSEFNTVEEGIAAYSKLFNELGINFANNDVFTTDIGNFDKTKIEIVCGTGFAKYNDIHNADNLEGPHLLNHISEAAESDALYAAHNSAIADPLTIEHPIIVASHYPIADWIPQNGTSSRCVYFNGHTHHNTKKETQQLLIYADNQIGLKRRRFSFKCAIIGDIYNPFADCTDGSYEITTDMYSQFFEYNHDYIRGTGTIDAQLADGTSQFIMIKQFGYYGFFIVDSAKGIKICMGGAIRKICCSADRKYIESNFGVMVANYLKILTPLRKFEEKASQEIKKIGLNGTIHGCIIDIDCFHHIMVNYIDHKITYYYSPSWGAVRNLNTFEETLDDICKLESSAINSQIVANYKKNLQEFPILSNHNQCMTHKDNVMQKVDIGRNGMYGASRKVKKLDRLFTDNVLCDWNERVLRPLS